MTNVEKRILQAAAVHPDFDEERCLNE